MSTLEPCPICSHAVHGGARCPRCDYDLVNRDARATLRRLRKKNALGNSMWFTGTSLVFFSFAALFGLGPAIGAIIAWSMVVTGTMLITFGLIFADSSKKLLVRAKERTQLPPARIV